MTELALITSALAMFLAAWLVCPRRDAGSEPSGRTDEDEWSESTDWDVNRGWFSPYTRRIER